jgi:aldehyde:ferredoxin oxidoreductase
VDRALLSVVSHNLEQKEGFSDWKNASKRAVEHENLDSHKSCHCEVPCISSGYNTF